LPADIAVTSSENYFNDGTHTDIGGLYDTSDLQPNSADEGRVTLHIWAAWMTPV